jgi:quinohemoprotein ethanol dehydrogenase
MRTQAHPFAALIFGSFVACQAWGPAQAEAAAASPAASAVAADPGRTPGASAQADQWRAPGRDAEGSYYSPLKDINTGNVARLGFAWQYKLGTHRGLEATPLVIDGVMYAVGNFGRVYALDAATGHEKWIYDPNVDGQWGRYACCDAINRGLAAFDGRIYVGALDGWLHAIDARTGHLLWKADTLVARTSHKPYTLSGAPLLAGDVIIVGNGGGDFAGVRGYVSAFDLKTGQLRWRFFTVPRNPADGPQDQPHLAAALKTWDPRHRWEAGVGGTVWDGMAYDPALELVYIGTGNPAPYDMHTDGRKGGDELYADSIIAIHVATGTLAWYYQTVPGDLWDYDSTQKMILADLSLEGRDRKVIMQAAKNGFYYVLDRATGELVSAHNFAYQNWTTGIDPKTGRPIESPTVDYEKKPKLLFPSEGGAHSWQPMAFDAQRGMTFIPTMEAGNVIIETAALPAGLVEGQFTTQLVPPEAYDPAALKSLYGILPPFEDLTRDIHTNSASHGVLRAWSVPQHRVVWEAPTATSWDGGVLATGGGLVFQGDANGNINAYSADDGRLITSLQLGSSMMAAPMTYRVGGTQYIAIEAGYGGGAAVGGWPLDPASAAYRYGNEGRIIALKIGGSTPPLPPPATDPPLPTPPKQSATAAEIRSGEVLYNRYCLRCHVFGRGILPDLRRIDPGIHKIFELIVRGGAFAPKGMGHFDDVLSPQDVAAIHAYLIDQSWKLVDEKAAHGK